MISYQCFSILLFIGIFLCSIQADDEKDLTPRDKKVFSLFSIVTFPNAGCASQSTSGSKARNGTCFTSTECNDKGGAVSGNCAAGFGVCCLFMTSTSGSTVSQNCSYIQNPNFPSAYASETAISFTVAKCASEVCTLRLDFCTFTTAGPTATDDSVVAVDSFQITTTPTNTLIPVISGENSGYHVYVDVGKDATATATLAFTFGTSTIGRSWEIKVTQIECSNRARPDPGCVQYHTGTSGRIESFNFKQPTATLYNHLQDQDYSICIRKEAGYDCIQYQQCGEDNSFGVSGAANSKAQTGSLCSLDYAIITGGADQCGTGVATISNYCGEMFSAVVNSVTNSPVCDCTAPFAVTFITNAHGTADANAVLPHRGLCLEWKQVTL